MEKTDNVEQQPLRRANLLEIVKNLSSKVFRESKIQDSYSRDWKSILSLTIDFMCDLRPINYCVFYDLPTEKKPLLYSSPQESCDFLPFY